SQREFLKLKFQTRIPIFATHPHFAFAFLLRIHWLEVSGILPRNSRIPKENSQSRILKLEFPNKNASAPPKNSRHKASKTR
ncbi:hypothetical protein, partial [Campylobacter sp.]|uniref:hypothetical protein n=1 Tax=Campylobacter sp. TaxID=205 RepID=UPI002AA6A763